MDIDATALSPELARALDEAIDRRFEAVQAGYLANLAIPSIKAAPAEGAPYGAAVGRALDHAAEAARELGLSARSVGGRAVIAEAGAGAEYVATIGHMDVVPPGAGWTREPFGPVVEGDRVYARGAADDKGGSFASLLAVAAIGDLLAAGELELDRAVRAILGGDEESGMSCLRHVMSVEPPPAWAVAPDGDWPVVFAEKGQALLVAEGACPEDGVPRTSGACPAPFPDGGQPDKPNDGPNGAGLSGAPDGSRGLHPLWVGRRLMMNCPAGGLHVASLAAGTRANVVPDLAEAVLAGEREARDAACEVLEGWWDRNVTFGRRGDGITVRATGLAGHGSRPHQGDNAAVRLLRALRELPMPGRAFWGGLFMLCDPGGSGLNLADCDDMTGATTCNLGVLGVSGGRVRMAFDIRYPARRDHAWVVGRASEAAGEAGLTIVETEGVPPVHQPIDGPLVQTVMAVYNAHTDEGKPPYSRGAKTYASYVPRCVCVGRTLPGEGDGGVHGADEHATLTGLRGAGRMLAELLIRLARTPSA
ncbi:MAG TPA: M20/M25/M40 family metallo-hydrolase [Phycisphaerae bacterium]|nr:M20/M25/M40 family metallo-hydrolase [Phycisphaerae bacterium]